MNIDCYSHDPDGRITGVYNLSPDAFAANQKRMGLVTGKADGETQYVRGVALTARPQSPAALAGRRLTKLPSPCVIIVNDTIYTCDETEADLEFDQPGTYRVRVIAWPYLDAEFNVENPAP